MSVGGGFESSKESGKTAPWEAQQPYLQKGFAEAARQFDSSSPEYYPGSTVADFSPQSLQGRGLMEGIASTTQLPGQAAGQLGSTLEGKYLSGPNASPAGQANPYAGAQGDIGANPYLSQGANNTDALATSIRRAVQPQVKAAYGTSGRTGESPLAQTAIARGISDSLAPIMFSSNEAEAGRRFSGGESLAGRQQASSEARAGRQFQSGESALSRGGAAYDAERQRQVGAAGMAPEINALQYDPAQRLSAVGASEDAKQQQYLNAAMNRWTTDQGMDAAKLNQYMDAVRGSYGSVANKAGSGKAIAGQTS